ncbi:CDP-glucose 4,6-dehydratase [bacterium]|nr:CDP-glucose 4,6-dehydratase [bacterium]
MHFLVTGHTGFKGAWLVHLLDRLGHEVSGLALDPVRGSLFEAAHVGELMRVDGRVDIRDPGMTAQFMEDCSPDVVIHMAAQPLVRASYMDPRGTFETNVDGTLSVLEALAATTSVRAAVVVTTDKVYRNVGKVEGYVEADPLGGHDPYSASKAMADILTASWSASFPGCSIGIARAGNVIGGCDVSDDRLFPDLVRAFESGRPAQLRAPESVRPWQHVLDCLDGYLHLVAHLLEHHSSGEAWNFAPDPDSFRSVGELATLAASKWGETASWAETSNNGPHEAAILTLDASKARDQLGWRDLLSFEEAVGWTAEWAMRAQSGESPRDITYAQVDEYLARRGGGELGPAASHG